jgi:hypothetical protein
MATGVGAARYRDLNSDGPACISKLSYSRGQAKPTNLVYRSGVHLAVRFFQILTQIVEMNQKTLL